LENAGWLDSNLIINSLHHVLPQSKAISKHGAFNIRAKLMKLLPVFKESNRDYNIFKAVVNSSDMLNGIDNEVSLDDDEAYEFVHFLWLEVVGTTNKDKGLFSFIEYLDLIRSKAKGFTYKIAESTSNLYTSNNGKKLLKVIWHTATMRRKFELFGDFLGLNMIKQGINTLLWPYFSVTMYMKYQKYALSVKASFAENGELCISLRVTSWELLLQSARYPK
jgi:hypothetical protein